MQNTVDFLEGMLSDSGFLLLTITHQEPLNSIYHSLRRSGVAEISKYISCRSVF